MTAHVDVALFCPAANLRTSPDAINWTSGYRRDATLPDEYEHFVDRTALERLLATQARAPSWFSGVEAERDASRIRDALASVRNSEGTNSPECLIEKISRLLHQ